MLRSHPLYYNFIVSFIHRVLYIFLVSNWHVDSVFSVNLVCKEELTLLLGLHVTHIYFINFVEALKHRSTLWVYFFSQKCYHNNLNSLRDGLNLTSSAFASWRVMSLEIQLVTRLGGRRSTKMNSMNLFEKTSTPFGSSEIKSFFLILPPIWRVV